MLFVETEPQPFRGFRIARFSRVITIGRKYGGIYEEKKTIYNMRNPGAYFILVDPSTRPPWTQVFMDEQGRPQTRGQIRDRFQGHYDDDDPDASASAASIPASRPE